jgi:hypothetical protein
MQRAPVDVLHLHTQQSHIAVEIAGGQTALVLANTGRARVVRIDRGLPSATVTWKENSLATLVWD